MTRFLSEKRRIEVMENDFDRLLQTSQAVEEKLAQVSTSDDVQQTIQVQLRRLDDAIKETDEKYQRVERKGKAIQETNDGIDKNFKALQVDEQLIKKLEETMGTLKIDMDIIERSVDTLSEKNEQAREAAEKLFTLDESVQWLEKRIAEMNVAREGLARLATELSNLDKDAQTQLKLTRSLLDREGGKSAARAGGKPDEGAPPPRDRENIIRLKRAGWTIEEIARSMKISKGEVELILELGPKDN
jgi:chromosome segregation ATPase